ncbi:RNH2B Ribonuclease, partial [Amia calva]|nr:RNH2B Ribonuclease [Amia calva]
ILLTDSVLDSTAKKSSDPVFVRLRNPTTGDGSLYMFGSEPLQLYEVKAFNEDYHSWFIGQTVQQDGRLLYITPMDPLYLVMPYLLKAAKEGKFQPVQQIVVDEDFPNCSRLLKCSHILKSLCHVTEEKEVGSQKFHRYSQEKTMKWLNKKVDRTVKALKSSQTCVGGGVKSSTFIRTTQQSDAQEEDYLRYAHGLISEYIPEDLSKDLLKDLQLPEITSPGVEPPMKKRKLSDKPVEAEEDYTKFNSGDLNKKPAKKLTAAQKTLAKVDKTGMKSLSAFFSPKVKAEKK